jgi:hypothetical protein
MFEGTYIYAFPVIFMSVSPLHCTSIAIKKENLPIKTEFQNLREYCAHPTPETGAFVNLFFTLFYG